MAWGKKKGKNVSEKRSSLVSVPNKTLPTTCVYVYVSVCLCLCVCIQQREKKRRIYIDMYK
jgi:hypothetical protein